MQKPKSPLYFNQFLETLFLEERPLFYAAHNIISETLDIIKYRKQFETEIADLYSKSEQYHLLRMSKWLYFFNQNYSKQPLLYHDITAIIPHACINNPLLRVQTTYEFESSLLFLEEIFNIPVLITPSKSDDVKYLLQIALLVGKYPGMITRSLLKGLQLLKEGIHAEQLKNLFEHLFVKYENPIALSLNLVNLQLDELDLMMEILRGKNILKIQNLPMQLTKKEAHLLIHNYHVHIVFEDNVLLRSILVAKLLMIANRPYFLTEFLTSCREFNFRLNNFIINFSFWKSVFELFSKNLYYDHGVNLSDCLDFLEDVIKVKELNYSIKGKTINQIIEDMHDWHLYLHDVARTKKSNTTWERKTMIDFIINDEPNQYIFKELTSGQELLDETIAMKHCVSTYIEDCYLDNCSIWSFQKLEKDSSKRLLTIEVRNNKIVQVAGLKNRIPKQHELNLIDQWAKANQFDLRINLPTPGLQ